MGLCQSRIKKYQFIENIGKGKYGLVIKATKRSEQTCYAIKRLSHNHTHLKYAKNENDILTGLRHPNIIRIHDLIINDAYIYLILDYHGGGDLFDKLITLQEHSF